MKIEFKFIEGDFIDAAGRFLRVESISDDTGQVLYPHLTVLLSQLSYDANFLKWLENIPVTGPNKGWGTYDSILGHMHGPFDMEETELHPYIWVNQYEVLVTITDYSSDYWVYEIIPLLDFYEIWLAFAKRVNEETLKRKVMERWKVEMLRKFIPDWHEAMDVRIRAIEDAVHLEQQRLGQSIPK
jgi:hypothetical protein